MLSLDNVHVEAGNCSVEVSTYHLLTVASHYTLTRCEIFWREDGWGDDKRNVRSIDEACLKVATALVTDEDLVTWEVGVLVNGEAVTKCTDLLCTHCERSTNLAVTVEAVCRTIKNRCFKDCCNVRLNNDEVRGTAKCLSMDLVSNVDNGLSKSLVPLTNCASESWSRGEGACASNLCTG